MHGIIYRHIGRTGLRWIDGQKSPVFRRGKSGNPIYQCVGQVRKVHETTTLLLVTLPNIHRLNKFTHRLTNKPFYPHGKPVSLWGIAVFRFLGGVSPPSLNFKIKNFNSRALSASSCQILCRSWRSCAYCKAFQMQFDEHLCNMSHGFNWHSASHGPSATGELFVDYTTSIIFNIFYSAMLRIRGTRHGPVSVRLSVCPSVTSRSSTKTAKRRIRETTPHNTSGTLVFWRQRSPRNSTGVTPYGAPNAGGVGQNRRLSTNNRLYLENGTR